MGSRRTFLKQSVLGSVALSTCWPGILTAGGPHPAIPPELRISLAQWSLHRSLEKGELKAENFPKIARRTFDIGAVEYVNQFYRDSIGKPALWNQLRQQADSEGVQSLLIMVDGEGELGASDDRERTVAVRRHGIWLEAAKILGCHSIRVNAFGSGPRPELKNALVDGLGRLAALGADMGIHILVENHGYHTSDAAFMTAILREVDHPYLGTLPDFGNWCLTKEWGSTQGGSCSDSYDPVKGVSEFLPYAKGVSAKSYDFDAEGNETLLPYRALLQKVKDSGFDGHIGIEYEGSQLPEVEGIRATKTLIEKVWATLD
ncbi:MAG: sugar phosphate isomerase/epimerase family protein [Robiginitalea sp.]|nr:sugar phosphate isomerase/epimerase family protein [Robiginitalea sp.]